MECGAARISWHFEVRAQNSSKKIYHLVDIFCLQESTIIMTWKLNSESEDSAFYMRLGQNIYSLRKAHNISQEELSRRADCSQKYISKIESGQAKPSAVLCVRIAKGLHCSMDMLFTGILSEGEANHFVVTATERVLMDEILQAVQNYLKHKK